MLTMLDCTISYQINKFTMKHGRVIDPIEIHNKTIAEKLVLKWHLTERQVEF